MWSHFSSCPSRADRTVRERSGWDTVRGIIAGATLIALSGSLAAIAAEPAASAVLFEEHFNTDVVRTGDWLVSDASVSVDMVNGWLHISHLAGYGSWGWKDIALSLPIVVEARIRLVSDGWGYTLPLLIVDSGGSFGFEKLITYLPGDIYGWNFMDTWTQVDTIGPPLENTWVTIRAVIRCDGGELMAKGDLDATFTPVAAMSWSIPCQIDKLGFRQSWDAVCDLDYIRVSTVCFDRGADINCDGIVNVQDVIEEIQIVFMNGTVIPCALKQ